MKETKDWPDKIVCFDFDGTVTATDSYPKIGNTFNLHVYLTMQWCKAKGYRVIVNSSRDTIHYPEVKAFLDRYNFTYDEIHLKCKPTADVYIDDKGLLLSYRHMTSFIESFLSPNFAKELVDGKLTSQMFTNMYSVPENPNHYHVSKQGEFVIGVPVTGGMDSSTLFLMAQKTGKIIRPFYVKANQEYWKEEIKAFETIFGITPEIIDLDVEMTQHSHILLGRNMLFLMAIANKMTESNQWGEIWFGNLQGETPTYHGDKSNRFLNDFNSFLVNHGYDIRLTTPLIGMNKFDQVNYWRNEHRIEDFRNTKTCFTAGTHQCGKCQACFRKFIAFAYHGIDIRDDFDTLEFDPHVKKYINKMTGLTDFSHYSKDRVDKTLSVIKKLWAEKN